ncbi:MAG TPA: peptidase, partial [Nitrosopumilaceae archaeon]
PGNVKGIITLQFSNLNDNSLATVGLPIVVDRVETSSEISIPDWVRNNASWWSAGKIEDNDFASGIEFMIKEGIIVIPSSSGQSSGNSIIPDWVRNNAGWWSEQLISDKEFANGLQYLIVNGIISVKNS